MSERGYPGSKGSAGVAEKLISLMPAGMAGLLFALAGG